MLYFEHFSLLRVKFIPSNLPKSVQISIDHRPKTETKKEDPPLPEQVSELRRKCCKRAFITRISRDKSFVTGPPKHDLGSIFHRDWSTVETCNLEYEYIEGGSCYPGTRNAVEIAGVTRSWVTRVTERGELDARLRVPIQMRSARTPRVGCV